MTRLRAIICALYYGLLPWWCYEREKHYGCSYVEHLCINLGHALKWAFFQEDAGDWDFEARTNPMLPAPLRRVALLSLLLLLPAPAGSVSGPHEAPTALPRASTPAAPAAFYPIPF